MTDIVNFEFVVGLVVGKILVGAVFAVPPLRLAALTLGAVAIAFAYATEGLPSIVVFAQSLRDDVLARPDFAKGMAAGTLTAFLVFGPWGFGKKS